MNRFFTLLLAASCLTAVGQYEVGDVGPAGGWIFYVDAENQFEDWDYLEVWPHTFSFFQLLVCDYSPYLSSPELGTGENNTLVFASNDDTFSAFDFAVLFDGGSRNDWFLPSKSELEALNASSVSALINSGEGYSAASSSVFGGCQWWTYDINNGWGIEDDLYSWEWVLPIRSFHTADDGIVCGQGTIWDEELQGCVSANTADINNDGCVQLNDLLDLLSAYGDCAAGESAWQCGDPLEYQGYDYETVQIGEQCWFAEDLRTQSFSDGTPISELYNPDGWYFDPSGACSFNCGLLYSLQAIQNPKKLCPNNYHVGTWEDYSSLFQAYGGQGVAAPFLQVEGWGWATNASGLGLNPSGSSFFSTGFDLEDIIHSSPEQSWIRTSTLNGSNGISFVTYQNSSAIDVVPAQSPNSTGAVRCIKD